MATQIDPAFKSAWRESQGQPVDSAVLNRRAAAPQEPAPEPVAWRENDFASGRYVYGSPKEVRAAHGVGAIVEPLYASPQPANPAQMTAPSDDLLAFCITETLGERCATFDADCYTCQAWSQYDCLKGSAMPTLGLIDEGLEILGNLADSITRHGNHSPESTCTFIDQAGQAFRKARSTLTQTEADNA